MFGFAYLAAIFGIIGAIIYVGLAGAAAPVQVPSGGIGLLLVLALQ